MAISDGIRKYERGRAHYVIDGYTYQNAEGILTIARSRGFTGSRGLLLYRLRKGCTSWDALCAAPSEVLSEARKRTTSAKRAEMLAVITELDARKKAMGLA